MLPGLLSGLYSRVSGLPAVKTDRKDGWYDCDHYRFGDNSRVNVTRFIQLSENQYSHNTRIEVEYQTAFPVKPSTETELP
jgi:hypothetical protein